MYNIKAFAKEMETCDSDMNGDCLITDLVHELSSGLEIPFLLGENIGTYYKHGSSSPTDTKFFEEQLKEDWTEEIYSSIENVFGEKSPPVKSEIIDDFDSYYENNNNTRTYSSSTFSRSGSECSSTEIWMTKNELDTPPVTPPDERVSPESVFLLPPDELRFTPIAADDNLPFNKNKTKNLSNISRKVRIQPKPVSSTFNIFETQPTDIQTVVCSVFSDINSNNLKNQTGLLESNIFSNSSSGKKSVLSKKDLELLQAKRKQERMIRNRESAYLSRKRKKEHVAHLEKQVQDLQAENTQLRLENGNLRQRLAKYEDIEPIPMGKKSGSIFTESPRKTTALLALLFTICLNIGSFSSFMNEKRIYTSSNEVVRENLIPDFSSELRHTRSLLWAESDLQSLNSTLTNLTKTSCPLSINQTESIRLESELRKWIGGDEDHTRSLKYNKSKINQYFYSGEKPSRHKNKSKYKQRSQNFNNGRGNVEMKMYHMKPNVFDFNMFFEAIHRRDDTFYLVSFSGDHLLLPALSHNKTSRPKMSLMLPAFLSNGTGADQVEMMQIDCEVTNTQLLSVNENDIPYLMKPYTNSTSRQKSASSEREKYEKYFDDHLSETLLNKRRNNMKAGKNDFMHSNGSANQTTYFKQNPSANSDSGELEIINIHYPLLDFNSSERNYQMGKFRQEKIPSVYNRTFKQNQNSVDFTSSGKSLLKLLMVSPMSSNGKLLEFNGEKTVKALKNDTR